MLTASLTNVSNAIVIQKLATNATLDSSLETTNATTAIIGAHNATMRHLSASSVKKALGLRLASV